MAAFAHTGLSEVGKFSADGSRGRMLGVREGGIARSMHLVWLGIGPAAVWNGQGWAEVQTHCRDRRVRFPPMAAAMAWAPWSWSRLAVRL